jgi:thiamine biosynthesis lipoprotein
LNKTIFTKSQWLIASLAILVLVGCAKQNAQIVTVNGKTMGTTYSVKYLPSDGKGSISTQQLTNLLDERLIQINQLMSTYISDSELSMLNDAPAHQAFPISEETASVIRKALELSELSDGMLDIAVGPIVNLWGFGPNLRPEKIPSPEQLLAAQALTGAKSFVLEGNSVIKSNDDVYIDLSTIAKGYAVDELALILESYNITNYLVEIGGEMRLSGKKPNEQDWVVAIEKPISQQRAIQRTIVIGNNAIATSGDYRNYYEEDGQRFSHLIDPKTAYPIQHNLVAVTVVAPSSMEADGLATALIVMGPETGKELAERENIAALFITKDEDGFNEFRSTAFDRQVKVIQ